MGILESSQCPCILRFIIGNCWKKLLRQKGTLSIKTSISWIRFIFWRSKIRISFCSVEKLVLCPKYYKSIRGRGPGVFIHEGKVMIIRLHSKCQGLCSMTHQISLLLQLTYWFIHHIFYHFFSKQYASIGC